MKYKFIVTVDAETEEQAIQVMSERIYHDEWLVEPIYTIDYEAIETKEEKENA